MANTPEVVGLRRRLEDVDRAIAGSVQDHVVMLDQVAEELVLRIGKPVLDRMLISSRSKCALERRHFIGVEIELRGDEPSHEVSFAVCGAAEPPQRRQAP